VVVMVVVVMMVMVMFACEQMAYRVLERGKLGTEDWWVGGWLELGGDPSDGYII